MAGYYPPVGFHFKVEFLNVDGVNKNDIRFSEVSGLSAQISVEEIKEGGENRFAHRLPARAKFGSLNLKRGMLVDSGLIKWFKDAVENFDFKPSDIKVTLLNEEHQPLVAWKFMKAWPTKWSVSDLKANDNSLVIETIELAYDYFTKMDISGVKAQPVIQKNTS